MATPPDVAALEAEADRAAARGDRAGARALLEQVTAASPGRAEPWMKLAAMCRANGDVAAALDAVSGALRIEPLGFMPLLLKASLLDAAGRGEEAGETYGYALSQKPEQLSDHLSPAVARAEERHREHVAATLARLEAATDLGALSPAEAKRIARFRTNIVRTTRVFHSEPTHFH